MLSSFSSNAILAKARAMYRTHLTAADYKNLLACQSVPEIALYLKQNTSYSRILTGVNENEIHRGQLESLLRQKLFYNLSDLGRYELSVGEHFSAYVLARSEIEQIMHSLTLLETGKTDSFSLTMPHFLEKHSRINLQMLAMIKNYNDLLNALEHSHYRKLLEPFSPAPGENINLTAIENALYTYLYNNVFSIIGKHTSGQEKRELTALFYQFIDLSNVVWITRLKKYYHAQPDYIRSFLLPLGTLKQKQLNQMLEAETPNQVFTVLRTTPLGKKISKIEYSYVDELPQRVKFLQSRHNIHFSVHPSVVMLSYIFLSEIEIANIINIVEGIRYHVPVEEITKMLIYVN